MASRTWKGKEYRPPLGRIDARPQNDTATQAGLMAVHKNIQGNVIGAITPEGQKLGTAKQASTGSGSGSGWRGGSATPMLDAGPQTPGLDSNPRRPVTYTSMAALNKKDMDAAQSVSANGDFGIGAQKKAQNLDGRQALFSDMQKAGSGGLTPEMSQRAQGLGVDQAGWRRGVAKLPAAPAMIASPGAPLAPAPSAPSAPAPMDDEKERKRKEALAKVTWE